jgi:hypothetical protein
MTLAHRWGATLRMLRTRSLRESYQIGTISRTRAAAAPSAAQSSSAAHRRAPLPAQCCGGVGPLLQWSTTARFITNTHRGPFASGPEGSTASRERPPCAHQTRDQLSSPTTQGIARQRARQRSTTTPAPNTPCAIKQRPDDRRRPGRGDVHRVPHHDQQRRQRLEVQPVRELTEAKRAIDR